MSAEGARNLVNELTKQLPPHKYPRKGIEEVWADLVKHDDNVLEAAGDAILQKCMYLPKPEQLLGYVTQQARLRAAKETTEREDEWNKQKGGARREDRDKQQTIFSAKQSESHGKHALQLLKLTINRDVPMPTILDGCRAMEASYPGPGWGLAGVALQKQRQQRCDSCVIGRTEIDIPGRDIRQAHKWYGCYNSDGCKHLNTRETSETLRETG